MGKLLYEQFLKDTTTQDHCLSWEQLPHIAQDAWNNVWTTSVKHCKIAVFAAFNGTGDRVGPDDVCDAIDSLRYIA